VSEDAKLPWPEYSPSSWFHQALMRYWETVFWENESDFPPEFLKAVEEHADKEFIFRKEMWGRIQHWREYAERYPDSKPQRTVGFFRDRNDREKVELFKDLILSAVFHGDEKFLQILRETVTLTNPPESNITPERAVIAAFSHRFGGDHVFRRGEDKLPTAMEVDYWAKGILKSAIGGPISDRQLKRIRKKVGAKTRRSKKKRKLKPGEDSERGIVLFGEEAKAAWEAYSNP
jgi:hypothetical protein